MRTSLMLLVGLVVSWSTEAQDESSACWSSAVCYKAGYSEMEWLEIYPQPNCISKSNIPKIVEYTRIQQKFNRSIVEFFKGLGSFATKACSSCNLYEVIEVGGSGHTYSDTEECFAPVVCAVDGRTIADFVQIRPFPSCNPGKKLHETSGEMESLFNSSREYVVKELKYFLYKNCNLCQTTRMENALATLTKSLWQPSIDTTQCYAPVICDDGDNSFKNWMKFPDIDCKAAKLTLLSEKPEKIFTSILERARAEIQNIVEEECSKSCDEKSSFSTSTFEAEHTTPEILQRASTKSDKETTSAALESMLQTSTTSEPMLETSTTSESMLETSTTSETMLQTSATSPKTTLDPEETQCEDGISYRQKCYFAFVHPAQDVPLTSAQDICERNHGKLADIRDREHQRLITNYLRPKIPSSQPNVQMWFGMLYQISTKTLQWSDGTIVDAPLNWYSTYPVYRSTYTHVAILVSKVTTAISNGLFNYYPTYTTYGAVCEK